MRIWMLAQVAWQSPRMLRSMQTPGERWSHLQGSTYTAVAAAESCPLMQGCRGQRRASSTSHSQAVTCCHPLDYRNLTMWRGVQHHCL